MTANFRNTAPFLRTSRLFPDDNPQALSVEVDRSYLEIASAVNARTIGVFALNTQAVNGESWFFSGSNRKEQGLRQVYTFTGAGNIAHGINLASVTRFTRIYGTFTNGSGDWYPLPYVDVVAANNQVSIRVDATNIIITAGAGAPPVITSGIVVLEWNSLV